MLNRDQVASFKALVYAYNTLASCKGRGTRRHRSAPDALEGKKNDLDNRLQNWKEKRQEENAS